MTKQRWTVDTLKEHFDARHNDLQAFVMAMFAERDKAIKEFKDTTTQNFASRNEIKTAMKDAAAAAERATAALVSTLMPRTEAMTRMDRNDRDIKDVTDRVNSQGGFGTGIKEMLGWILAAGALLFSVFHK
jgi:hypothetical protein